MQPAWHCRLFPTECVCVCVCPWMVWLVSSFIVSDLEHVNRDKTPWVIVGGHRPFYVSSTYYGRKDSDITVADDLRNALEDLFLKHEVS